MEAPVAEIARLSEEATKKWGRANELIAFFLPPGEYRGEAWPGLPLGEGDSMGYMSRLTMLNLFISTLDAH